MENYLAVLKKYAIFTGRARRTEYWMFLLVSFGISIILEIIDAAAHTTLLGILYSLAILIPSVAVGVRRLHDTGRSGWWLLLALIPIVGTIIVIVWYATDSQPGENAYGPNPKGAITNVPVA
jgi:uncharacterized membrane protein YhaH (DUF805 family)